MKDLFTLIKFSPWMFVRWIAFAPAGIFFVLLSWLLSPVLAAYSVIAGVNVLPGILQWFSTVDDDLDGGQHQHPEIYPLGVTGFKLWWQRTCWICRNPANGFDCYWLGYKDAGAQTIWENTGENSAYSAYQIAANGKRYFTFKRYIFITDQYFIKLWIGWNNRAYDKINRHFILQLGLKKKK